jgi:hypothetical protein
MPVNPTTPPPPRNTAAPPCHLPLPDPTITPDSPNSVGQRCGGIPSSHHAARPSISNAIRSRHHHPQFEALLPIWVRHTLYTLILLCVSLPPDKHVFATDILKSFGWIVKRCIGIVNRRMTYERLASRWLGTIMLKSLQVIACWQVCFHLLVKTVLHQYVEDRSIERGGIFERENV